VGVVGDLGEPVLFEERELGGGRGVLVEDLDGLAPLAELGGVELAEVEHLALHDLAALAAPVLDDVVVGELPAVSLASVFL